MSNLMRFLCLILVLAVVPQCETENGNPLENPEITMATVQGVVNNGGSRISGAEVLLIGPGIERTTTTGQDGTFTFADVPPGAYTVTAAVAGVTCNAASVDVQTGQTAAVSIACDQTGTIVGAPTGTIFGTLSVDGFPIGRGTINGAPDEHARVALSGPLGDRTTSTGHHGHFGFDSLPPGSYTLAAHALTRSFLSPTTVFPLTCESITVIVQASQTVEANISCTIPEGTIGGTVTINGEARPIVWVELQFASSGFPWAYGTTIPSGGWEWREVPAVDYVVVLKTPPGLSCDATRKSATVDQNQRTVVNFACVGDVKGSIQGFASNEFGTFASARVTLTGPVNRETISNQDGFFAFEDLPPGDYVVGLCADPVSVTVRDGETAFVQPDCS